MKKERLAELVLNSGEMIFNDPEYILIKERLSEYLKRRLLKGEYNNGIDN